jgi:pimeloyl-ACP methyl ester carboxylesterase
MRVIVLGLALLGLVACGPPIRVTRVSGPAAYRSITANALWTDRASEWTRSTINEWGLVERFDDQPEAALATLRKIVTSGRAGNRELFALAELSFLHAANTGRKSYYRASAVYAYAFLFPERSEDLPGPFDPRARLATDLYNRAITMAFASRDGRSVEFTPGRYRLPFGVLDVTVDPAQFHWGDRRLTDFAPVAELEIRGMRNRHRIPGLGAALAARAIPREDVDVHKSLIAPRARVAATAVLRLHDVHDGIVTGRLRGSLELYTASETETVTMDGREVPLEIEETAVLAVQLAAAPVWQWELWGFFGRVPTGDVLPILVALDPYRPGRIPLVFVHGTASSPGRWADMVNDLLADPWIRQRYQFWVFTYETGNPIAYSGMLLRDKLTEAVARMDPAGSDPCLREMVVIGHSQGGLLTKLTAVDTGDRLWNAIFRVPPEELPGSETFRNLLRRALFVEPLPFVRRLVFVATPHRGSFLTGAWLNNLLRRWIRFPTDLVAMSADTLTRGVSAGIFYERRAEGRLPSATDNMTAGNPFLEGLAAIPVADGVPYHSIVAVKENFAVVEEGDDGVVRYRSAHLDGAASELVVRSSHSTQSNPHTIQEVRRILHLHGEALEAAGMRCGPGSETGARTPRGETHSR